MPQTPIKSVILTKIGYIEITTIGYYIVGCIFVDSLIESINHDAHIITSIRRYFFDFTKKFPLRIKLIGTEFQLKVWLEILKIPYGNTKSYSKIAQNIGHPRAYRAVANACGNNPISLLVPCHRVVATNNIGGYRWGLNAKKWLLEHESIHK